MATLMLGALPIEAAPPRKIRLDVKDADVHDVLRLLAEVGKVNLVVAGEVRGKVTLKLVEAPWDQALEVVLRAHGLGQTRRGNIIEVEPLARIASRAAAEAQLARAREETAELHTVFFPLSYAQASELRPLVASLLSPRGRVEVDARTNTLVVTDIAENIEVVRASLAKGIAR